MNGLGGLGSRPLGERGSVRKFGIKPGGEFFMSFLFLRGGA